MPKRLKRYYGQDHLHYLTCSCYHRQPWLASAARRDLFANILEETRQRYRFVVVGYVLMPDHIHLLLSEPEHGTPSHRDAGGEAALRARCPGKEKT
jgi:putative transposase